MKKILRLMLLISISSLSGVSQETMAQSITSFSRATASPQQYGKVEFDISVAASFSNAYNYTDISLDLIATSPSGKTITLPCYYASGASPSSAWKARFAPKEVGNYSYFFRLNKSNAQVNVSASAQFTVAATAKDGFLRPSGNNWTFKFDSGKAFRAHGENYGWEPRSFENQKYRYEYMLPRLASNGGNFIRTWMCPWNLPLEWHNPKSTNFYSGSTQYFNPSAITRMDQLIDLAENNGIYMMLTLNTFGDLQDDWGNNNYNKNNGGPATTPNDFFALSASKEKFKNRLRYLVARWGYSTSVGAWEFFNEIDNAVYALGLNQNDVTQWHNDMSAYLKSIDPYGHLVTTSVSYRDITGLSSVPSFDFNQRHIYSDPQLSNPDVITTIPSVIRNYDASTGKPYVIGEYGYDWRGPDSDQGAANDDNYKRGLWYGIFSPTPIAPMSWWWEMFDDRNTISYLNKVKDISDKMLAAGGGSMSEVSVSGNGNLAKYGVQCGSSYFLYARNNSTGSLTTDVSLALSGSSYNVKIYNTTTGAYIDQGTKATSGGRLYLPGAGLGGGQDVIFLVSSSTPVVQAPYGGTAWAIPGTIQSENYDLGGEGVAYHDNSAGNSFNVGRSDDVDVENCTDTGTGYSLGNTEIGEWTEYTVNVNAAGAYDLDVRVATINAGKTFHIEMNGVNVSGNITVPNTGGWQTWQTVTLKNISLTAGQKVMRIAFDTDLFNLNYVTFKATVVNQLPTVSIATPTIGSTFTAPASVTITANASDIDGNITAVDFYNGTTLLGSDNTSPYSFNWSNVSVGTYLIMAKATDNSGAAVTSATVSVAVNPAAIVQSPYGGTPANIPGTIQAENYDLGGEGIAYHDISATNTFNVFRTDGVDLENCTDAGTGYDIADVAAGEWTEYTVNVTADGNYDVAVRVATVNAGKFFHIELDGVNITGTIAVPNTGGWQVWQTVTVKNVALTAGQKIMKVSFDTDLFNLNYLSFQPSVTVINQAPVVSLTSPVNNANFNTPATLVINANASDVDGSVSKVDFYNGTTLLGSDNTAPYSYSWTNVAAGTYSISAKATDNTGTSTISASITVVVKTVSTNVCAGIGSYTENAGYVAGSKVQNVGKLYECKPWPYSGWCNGAAWAYAPGTGAYWSDAWSLVASCSSARVGNATVNPTVLSNAPNPFSQTTELSVLIAEAGDVSLKVFDKTGLEVATVFEGYLTPGTYRYLVEGNKFIAGLYIVQLQSNLQVITTKIMKAE